MKNKNLLLIVISLIFVLNSCKKDKEEVHVFERGGLISVNDIGTKNIAYIKNVFSAYDVNLSKQINYQFDVDLYVITYETITATGEETEASGLIAIPKGISTSAPLLSFQHGTTLKQTAAPSNIILGSGMEVGLIFATEGYIVCMPDFLGLGKGNTLNLDIYLMYYIHIILFIIFFQMLKMPLKHLIIQTYLHFLMEKTHIIYLKLMLLCHLYLQIF